MPEDRRQHAAAGGARKDGSPEFYHASAKYLVTFRELLDLVLAAQDFESALEAVARHSLPNFGAWSIVDLIEAPGTMRRLAIIHPDPDRQEVARGLPTGRPPGREDLIGAPVVIQTREPHVVREVTDEMLDAFARTQVAAERQRQEREHVMEVQARLVRGFSHELKNPLGAARGYADLLATGMKGDLEPDQLASVERIRSNIEASLDPIDDGSAAGMGAGAEADPDPLPTEVTPGSTSRAGRPWEKRLGRRGGHSLWRVSVAAPLMRPVYPSRFPRTTNPASVISYSRYALLC